MPCKTIHYSNLDLYLPRLGNITDTLVLKPLDEPSLSKQDWVLRQLDINLGQTLLVKECI
mgnify:CR=1 FL=1